MPFAYKNAELEHDSVVVHGDQRGAGKSYRPDTPNMAIAQFVSDALELSRRLHAEFGGRKIILVGHSWGTVIGALTFGATALLAGCAACVYPWRVRPQRQRGVVGLSLAVALLGAIAGAAASPYWRVGAR